MSMDTGKNAHMRRGVFISFIGIVCNLLLAGGKLFAGLVSGLVSVVADGVNNLSDCGSCLISALSFRIAAKPADSKHPFGHQRVEYIASMATSFLVLLLAVELLKESILKILSGESAQTENFVLIILGVSVAVKMGMFFFYRHYAGKLRSDTLRAAAVDSACDCLATLAAGAGAVLCRYGVPADGWIGVFVALFIFWQGLEIFFDASSKLLGQAPSKELFYKIKEKILQEPGVLGLHDLKIYPYGPRKFFATVHIETDAKASAIASHELLDRIERAVKAELDIDLTAHLDPVALDDEEARELEQRVRAAIEGMVEGMDVHDFRLVRGARTKVVFEVGIPYSCKESDAALENHFLRAVKVLGDYDPVITVERE